MSSKRCLNVKKGGKDELVRKALGTHKNNFSIYPIFNLIIHENSKF